MAKSDGAPFQIRVSSACPPPPSFPTSHTPLRPANPSAVCSRWAAGVAVRQEREGEREQQREGGEQGLHQGCSLDRANKSRPVTCSMAPFQEWGKFGQSEEKGRHSLFSLAEQLTACDRQEVRRAGRAGICFHGYGPGMGTLLLRKLRSHAPAEAMSRILKNASSCG